MTSRISVRPTKDGSVVCIDGKDFILDNSAEVISTIEKQLLITEQYHPKVLDAIVETL